MLFPFHIKKNYCFLKSPILLNSVHRKEEVEDTQERGRKAEKGGNLQTEILKKFVSRWNPGHPRITSSIMTETDRRESKYTNRWEYEQLRVFPPNGLYCLWEAWHLLRVMEEKGGLRETVEIVARVTNQIFIQYFICPSVP